MELTIAAIGVAAALIAVFLGNELRKWANFFSDRNIPYVSGVWPLGSDLKAALMRRHFGQSWTLIYEKLAPHKLGGYFTYIKPIVMVRDPEFIHRVYVSDFSHFVDRGFIIDEKKDPLDAHLFFLAGEKWKYLRSKLSPIFSSGKLKWMFEQMKGSSDKFVDNFYKTIPLGKDVSLKEPFARFTTDVISSCAFGIESNAMGDPDSRFREMGKKFFDPSVYELFKFILRFAVPNLLINLKIRTTPLDISNFFINVVQQTFENRLKTGFVRKDFIQLLLELREKGHVELDQTEKLEFEATPRNGTANGATNTQKTVIELDDDILAAQLFVFFVAGFETTSSTLYHATYLLSINQECQDKARAEAQKVLDKHGEFTYDSVKELTYIDNCIKETLRLLPPVPVNFRQCTKDYTFPDGTKIEKGMSVILPTIALQYDPAHFPEPKKFEPERFDGPIARGTYSPFGDGPRICIGKRFAEVEVKVTLAKLLLGYKFCEASAKADLSAWEPASVILALAQPLEVRVEKIGV